MLEASTTPAGARASAVIYSLIETAKETRASPLQIPSLGAAGGPQAL